MSVPDFLLSGGKSAPAAAEAAEPLCAAIFRPGTWSSTQVAAWAETEQLPGDTVRAVREHDVSGADLDSDGANALLTTSASLDADDAAQLLGRWVEFKAVARHLTAVANVNLTSEDLSSLGVNSDVRLAEVQQRLNRSEQPSFSKQHINSQAAQQQRHVPVTFSMAEDASALDGGTEQASKTAAQLQTFIDATFACGALEDDAVLETFADEDDDDGEDFDANQADPMHPDIAPKVAPSAVDDEFDALIDSHTKK